MPENNKHLWLLAQYLGIQTHYKNAFGDTIVSSDDVLIKIINALGIQIKDKKESIKILQNIILEKVNKKIDEVHVLWNGKGYLHLNLNKKELDLKSHFEIYLDNGSLISKKISAKQKLKTVQEAGVNYYQQIIKLPKLPIGYHHLTLFLNNNKYNTFLISAPVEMYTEKVMKNEKLYGLFTPIYALYDKETLGCGDLGSLKKFANWLASKGGSIIATMPFFSSFLKEHYEPSPYSPVSRMFWNENYLDLKALGIDLENHPQVQDRENPILNLKKIAAYKRELIQKEIPTFLSQEKIKKEFQTTLSQNPELHDYALFRTYKELSKETADACPSIQDLNNFQINENSQQTYEYHLFVQWQMTQQLKALKKQINDQGQLLYLDFPVGVHKDGFDVWRFQKDFVNNMSIGAPPDPVFKHGQDWGSPPLHPINIRKNNYAYLINLFRNLLLYVDILRIDHVMGFNHLYWIPQDSQTLEGAFVQYHTEEIYAILCIESNRYKTVFIGENLGLVSKSTNQMMQKHCMLQMHILQYLLDSKISLTPKSKLLLASLNTHDMPTFYAYCNALDIKKNYEKHFIATEMYKKELASRNKNLRKLKQLIKKSNDEEQTTLASALKLLAKSQAQILIINIEDLWNEEYAQNNPGSLNKDNWNRRLAYSLDEIAVNPEVNEILNKITHWRKENIFADSQKLASLIGAHDLYLFNEGRHFRLYECLGAHPFVKNGTKGINFAVWAPNASKVSVIGSFNCWDKEKNQMQSLGNSGIWEIFIPEAQEGDLYKYYIHSKNEIYSSERSDPFAFYQEIPPKTASIIWNSNFSWNDSIWMNKRQQLQNIYSPISIYEVHIGSWKRIVEENNRCFNYKEMAPILTDYILAMNFTHVEFLPVMEHPFYGSWGYQTLGYFAPSSRYGTPDDFKFLIDYLHQHNIGVILDWVPSHFPNDLHGLAYFDGTHLYEHADPKKGFHPDWKSAIFNYGRHEIKSFLISSAIFWLDKFHIDGIRVDAVASMLYLNYSRNEGEWIPNEYGGRENLEAIQFLKELNETAYSNYPDIQTFAEESTAWPGVSRPTYLGGLGFGFKWDMGWMHDTLSYLSKDPIYRSYHQHQFTFRMIYAFTENFILSLSHDEVVHGKGSIINKMPGNEWEQFANLRLLYGYMFALPGKKLMFMGNEFGQRSEWNHESSLDWHVLQYAFHSGIQKWVKRLNHLYKTENALYDFDQNSMGFEWIDVNDSTNSVYSFLRKSHNNEIILVILNCTPITRSQYRIGVPPSEKWRLLLSSDDKEFGGAGILQDQLIPEPFPYHNRQYSLVLDIPGLSTVFYKCT